MKNAKQQCKTKNFYALRFTLYAFLVLVLIPLFFASAAGGLVPCGTTGNLTDGGTFIKDPCQFSDFFVLINNVINFLLVDIAFPLSALAFAVAGWMYLTAAGDTGKIKTAHDIFKNVAIGLIIAFSAWLIVKAILLGLGIQPGFSQLQNVGQ